MENELKCIVCKKSFSGMKLKMYCSNDCYNKKRRQKRNEKNKEQRRKEVNRKYYLKTKYVLTKKYKIEQEKRKKDKIEYNRKWEADNKDKRAVQAKKARKKSRLWINKYKRTLKCEICGYNKCYEALDFHHKDLTKKEFSISQSLTKFGKEKILEEIKKCKVLCSNCHRELHFEEKQKNMSQIKKDYENMVNEPKKIYYAIVEKEFEKEWVKELKDKAKYNLNRFGGNQYTKVDNKISEKIDIKKVLAKKIGIGQKTVCRIIQIHKRGTEEQKQRVRTGECSISKVYGELEPIRYSRRK